MDKILTSSEGVLFLVLYGFTMIAIAVWASRGHKKDKSEFLLANRSVSVFPGAMSIAASWIWAPALFIASQKAYDQGMAGVFWFVVPNVLALLLFIPLALRIRRELPMGYTLPQFIREKHGKSVHTLYLIQFFGLQICSFAVQILAGSILIELLTGLSFVIIATSLVSITLTYALLGGIRASISTDFLQMCLIMLVAGITVPWVIFEHGGFDAVVGGLGGITGVLQNPLDPWIAYSFGIPVTIGLLSGPIGDQMHWQRAYAINKDTNIPKAFGLGAVFFVIVPITLSLLGFIAANPDVASEWVIDNHQLVGITVVTESLPSFMAIAFAVMLLSGLCSTLDSVLCATSSLTTIDLVNYKNNKMSDASDTNNGVFWARIGMLATAIIGLAIALIPGLKILHLFLFYGTLRASTMIPTVLSLFWKKLNSNAVFVAILLSLIIGAPLYAAGAFLENPHLSVAGSLSVVIIGLGTCLIWSIIFPKKY